MEQAIFIGIVVGVTEAIKAAFDENWRTVAIIVGAGVTGGVLGAVSVIGVIAGVSLGLAASGLVTTVKAAKKV